MHNVQDIYAAVLNGQRPVVTFGKGIGDKESYAEEHMRARIVGAAPKFDCLTLEFDFDEFDAHNRAYESANYYDKEGKAVLTARQANYYKPRDSLYFDPEEPLAGLMTLDSDAAVSLYAEYKQSASGTSYIGWLEQQLMAARAR